MSFVLRLFQTLPFSASLTVVFIVSYKKEFSFTFKKGNEV